MCEGMYAEGFYTWSDETNGERGRPVTSRAGYLEGRQKRNYIKV